MVKGHLEDSPWDSEQVSLERAQREIAEDWEGAYHRYARVKCKRGR